MLHFIASRDRGNAIHFLGIEHLLLQLVVVGSHLSLVCGHGLVEHASRTCHCWACKRGAAHQTVLRTVYHSPRALAIDEKKQKGKKDRWTLRLHGNELIHSDHCLRL